MSHTASIQSYQHNHDFLGEHHGRNERRTWWVVGLTAAMMVVEIAAGLLFGSMALLADGIHMSTHAGALAIAGFAYWFARRHVLDRRFAFGTGKVGDLAGFSSALILALIALSICVASVERIAHPVPIAFTEAIAVAFVGLLVNLASAWLLMETHSHDRPVEAGDEHGDHRHRHADHNLRSAYFHVLADALTSVLAIFALLAALYFGWIWMDAVMGIVGAAVIARWSYGLLRDTGAVLVDASQHTHLAEEIRRRVETGDDRLADLHVWRVGPGRHAAILSVVTDSPQPAAHYKACLAEVPTLGHLTVEVTRCRGHHPH